ncbi:MAG: Hsp70 family protein [Vicinamibacteria bacterium]
MAGRVLIGSAARSGAIGSSQVNEDFKIELGQSDPTSAAPKRRFRTSQDFTKTPAELTSDFLHQVLAHTTRWLELQGYSKSPNILLAEPIAMQSGLVESDWLSNYRRNLQRILVGKGFSHIDFLPEPFAVFQYYRYGLKHPLVAEKKKHNALVLDFGGGTFDVCVISTTREGDISQSGRSSRPLAAASIAVGGFFINRAISLDLFRRHFSEVNKQLYKRAAEAYHRWLKAGRGDDDLSALAPEVRSFVVKLHLATHLVEDLKLTLCRNIPNWKLDCELSLSAPVALPADPFSEDDRTISARYSARELRLLFEKEVWHQHLRPTVAAALKRAHEELDGAPISVVLLSGGSANIGWLRQLLERDFAPELTHADVMHLPDFQEVVAKGLAVECARRFCSGEGDFSSVTYNRLCLMLDPDSTGPQLTRFRPRSEGLPNVADMPGVLLPSASVVGRFIGRPMAWKFRLTRPPKQRLAYSFLRSSFDPADVENLQNVEERFLHTPQRCEFDQDLKLNLTVEADGTARTRFVYKTGRSEAESTVVEGRPFFLDMTYASAAPSASAYLGLDFGSSNSAVSFVTDDAVQVFRQRSGEEQWQGLSDLAISLPFPLADPLSRYLSQTDSERLTRMAREFLEAAFAMLAYVALSDYAAQPHKAETRFFKSLTQRSIGPLWGLLKGVLEGLPNPATGPALRGLLQEDLLRQLDEAVTFVGQLKHDKAEANAFDHLRVVRVVANVSQVLFSTWLFGVFEDVRLKPFSKSHVGRFRQACGTPPFTRIWSYEGEEAFSGDQAFLINPTTRLGLPLQPFVFWDQCSSHPDKEYGHCYLFDRAERGADELLFKAAGHTCTVELASDGRYEALAARLREWRIRDQSSALRTIGVLEPVTIE